MEKRYLYLMISKTDTGVGSIIRKISRFPYNHTSMTLDPSFRNWVSFARYVQDTPLYGGYIVEPAERFLAKGYDVLVRIFRVELQEAKYEKVAQLFSLAGVQDGKLIYNLYDAPAAALGIKLPISGSYTCLSFACSVLDKDYLNIEELDRDLAPCLIYDGPLSALVADSGSRTDVYFSKLGLVFGLWKSLRNALVLTGRAFSRDYTDQVRQQLHG